ncbi:hypothetical protein HPB51_028793 [Rhipicephalus microplus]|uniref:Uncharacterized protein n=1 Tax=Rhipicephalus microplus TaxID=6941 RepID=A0A9J6CWH4_RHIMP|nr:hypothetical protein HPB51_028793 [Rhipicephalus microplus]
MFDEVIYKPLRLFARDYLELLPHQERITTLTSKDMDHGDVLVSSLSTCVAKGIALASGVINQTEADGVGSGAQCWPYYRDIHRFLGYLPLHDENLADENGCNEDSPAQEASHVQTLHKKAGPDGEVQLSCTTTGKVLSYHDCSVTQGKRALFDKIFKRLDDMISSFLRFDQTRNSEKNIQILAAEECKTPPTTPSVDCRNGAKRSPRKPMRHRQCADRRESNGSSDDEVAQRKVLKGEDTKAKSQPSRQSTHSATRVFENSQGNALRVHRLCLNSSISGHFVTQCRLPLTAKLVKW